MQETIEQPRVHVEQVAAFAVLLLVDSLHFVFARLLLPHIPPMTSAFYVLAIATVQVGLFAATRRNVDWDLGRSRFAFFAAIGFLIAASTVLSYTAVAYVDAGTAAMLGKTGVIFGLLLSVFWLRERLRPIQWMGAALAIVGLFIVSYQPGSTVALGALVIVASAFMYALHTALVKRYGQHMSFLGFFFYRLLLTTLFLFIFVVAFGNLVMPDAYTWLLLTIAGTVDVVISRSLYYLTLRLLTMSLHTIILTLSPVVSILVALLLFQTFPSVSGLLGGATILAGVYLATRSR
jgi:drug/metabolite transporter (DMT)-like permease